MENDSEAIFQAVKQRNLQAVEARITAGGDANLCSESGWALLHGAALYGTPDMVRILIDAGADVQVAEKHRGKLPIHIAAMNGDVETTMLLLAAGADINDKDQNGETALTLAAFEGKLMYARCLVEAGADVRIVGKLGKQALYWAAGHGDVEMARLLVEAGADINAPDANHGFRAIHIAASGRHAGMVEWLVGRGADVDATDENGMTALRHVVMDSWDFDNDEVLHALVKAGANPEAIDNGRETPMTAAIGSARTALLAAIAEKEAGELSAEAGKAPAANAARRRI